MQERKYRLSIWGGIYKKLGVYAAIDRLIENGYYAMEYPDIFTSEYLNLPREEYLAEAEKINAYTKERGFEISQGHLLFNHEFLGDEPLEIMKKNIDFLYAAGVRNMVLHVTCPEKYLPLSEVRAKYFTAQAARLNELIAYIGDRDAVLCLENVIQNAHTERADLLMEYVHACGDSEHLGICLDTGHLNRSNGLCHTNQTYEEFFKNAEGRVKALHVNGNAGNEDQHLLPFTGKEGVQPSWVNFMKALGESGYSGLFNFEVPGERNYVPLKVRDMKLRYAKEIFEYMTGEDFLKDAELEEWEEKPWA